MKPNVYFATLEGAELAKAVMERFRAYERFVKDSGLFWLWCHMRRAYMGTDDRGFTTHELGTMGDQDELGVMKVNHLRSVLTLYLNTARANRSVARPVALGRDYEAEVQVKKAKATLEYWDERKCLPEQEDDMVEFSVLFGVAYYFQGWNEKLGELVTPSSTAGLVADEPEPQPMAGDGTNPPPTPVTPAVDGIPGPPQVLRTGELVGQAFTPLDVAFDPQWKDRNCPWHITRSWVNKYDMAARLAGMGNLEGGQSLQDIIVNLSTPNDCLRFEDLFDTRQSSTYGDTDFIPVYMLLHDKTESVPEGKMVLVLNEQIAIDYGGIGLDETPLIRLAPSEIIGTGFGYSQAWDLLAPQQAIDVMASIQVTNAKTFGVGAIMAPAGSKIAPIHIAEGLALVEYTQGLDKPEPLKMPTTPAEIINGRQNLVDELGTIVGVNQVMRGNPEASFRSGAALALVDSKGGQYSLDFQKKIVKMQRSRALQTIKICQKYMKHPMDIPVVGRQTAAMFEQITGKDFEKVCRVRIDMVNPLSMTLSGRLELAENIFGKYPSQLGPEDYLRLIENGNLDHVTEPGELKSANAERENELLAEGIGPPPVDPMGVEMAEPGQLYVRTLLTDDHRFHIPKHLQLLENPAIRMSSDPIAIAVRKAVLDHVDEHERQLETLTLKRPGLLELTGQAPLQSAMLALPPPPGAPDGGGPPPGPPGPPGAPGPQDAGPPGAGEMPKLPKMPKDPRTGERVNPPPPPT